MQLYYRYRYYLCLIFSCFIKPNAEQQQQPASFLATVVYHEAGSEDSKIDVVNKAAEPALSLNSRLCSFSFWRSGALRQDANVPAVIISTVVTSRMRALCAMCSGISGCML